MSPYYAWYTDIDEVMRLKMEVRNAEMECFDHFYVTMACDKDTSEELKNPRYHAFFSAVV